MEAPRIGICGSASVGKTTLVNALAETLRLPTLREEMRDYLVRTGTNLTSLPSAEIEVILLQLWQERQGKERLTPAFVADNSPLDFAVYARFYGCSSDRLLEAGLANLDRYNAIVVLPWGMLPYEQDGIRPANSQGQLHHQSLLEDLLRTHVPASKLHFLPSPILQLEARVQWAASKLQSVETLPLLVHA